MKPLTSGVRKNSFWKGLSGPTQIRSPPPTRTRFIPTAYRPQIMPAVKMPVRVRYPRIADDLNLPRIADAESILVGEADVLDRERIESHQLRRDGVDGDLIG